MVSGAERSAETADENDLISPVIGLTSPAGTSLGDFLAMPAPVVEGVPPPMAERSSGDVPDGDTAQPVEYSDGHTSGDVPDDGHEAADTDKYGQLGTGTSKRGTKEEVVSREHLLMSHSIRITPFVYVPKLLESTTNDNTKEV